MLGALSVRRRLSSRGRSGAAGLPAIIFAVGCTIAFKPIRAFPARGRIGSARPQAPRHERVVDAAIRRVHRRRRSRGVHGGAAARPVGAPRLSHRAQRLSPPPRRRIADGGRLANSDTLGLRQSVMRSGALLLRRSRVRWARPAAELLTSDHRGGWLLVDRGNFDALLLDAAESEGACVLRSAKIRAASHGERGWQVEIVCEGKSHLIEAASGGRNRPRRIFRANRKRLSPRTIAICGHLRCRPGADEVVVEALPDGWCWGAPVPGGKFSAMVFVDPERLRTVRRDRLHDFWRSQLARTELLAAVSECRWTVRFRLATRPPTPLRMR